MLRRGEFGGGMKGDATYFARRALEERNAASKAAHPAAKRSHIQMAEHYEGMGAAIGSGKPMLKVVTREPKRP